MNKSVVHETVDDANLYLAGSLVKLGRSIVRVIEVLSFSEVVVDRLDGRIVNVDYSDLDLSPIKLGYVYDPHYKETFYFERIPARQWRQGLTSSTLRDKKGKYYDINGNSRLFNRISKRRFPSPARALRLAKKNRSTIPFNSRFAVDHDNLVYYKTKLVGSIDSKHLKFTLLEPYYYLEPELKETVNVYSGHL